MVTSQDEPSLIDLPPTRENEESIRHTRQWIKFSLRALIKASWEIQHQYRASGNNQRFVPLLRVVANNILSLEELAHCYSVDTDEIRRSAKRNLSGRRLTKKKREVPSGQKCAKSSELEDNPIYDAFIELLTAPMMLSLEAGEQTADCSEQTVIIDALSEPGSLSEKRRISDTNPMTEPLMPPDDQVPILSSTQIICPSGKLRRKMPKVFRITDSPRAEPVSPAERSDGAEKDKESETRPFGPDELQPFQKKGEN